jgi:hypothetical protein
MKKLFTVLFLICITTISAFALDFKISVDVRADDEQIEQSVKNYVVQGLRAIKDVKVVEKGDWNIRIMVIKHKLEDQKTYTYSLSAVMSSQASCAVKDSQQKTVSSETCDRLEDFATYMGGEKNLPTMSRDFVSDFNSNILEYMREPYLSNPDAIGVD